MRELITLLALYYAAALLHESAHALAGELLGMPVKGFRFSWGSIAIVRETGSPLTNLLISCAGPLLSLLVAWALWPYLRAFSLANFCVGLVNLIPIRNSDGDRILICMGQLGWIGDGPASSRDGRRDLRRTHHPAAPGLLSLPKMESNIYLSRLVTRNSGNQ